MERVEAQLVNRWKIVWLFVALGLCLSVAYGAAPGTLTLYRGGKVTSQNGLTFDGKVFTVPGHAPIPRNAVQSVEFPAPGQSGNMTGNSAGPAALSPLAKAQLGPAEQMAHKYAGASGVILVDDGIFTYEKDGTNRYRYHFAGLVLKEKQKSWAQFSVDFEQGRSRVRVLYARSVSRTGVVRSLTPEGLRISSPSEQMEFFNPNLKVLSGVIPGVEVGSIVEYEYEYENYNPPDPRLFSPGYIFQGTQPVVFTRVRVKLPKGTTFHYMTRHFPEGTSPKPSVEEHGDDEIYTWSLHEVPPITPEPMMPPMDDVVPTMQASIFKNFDAVYSLLKRLQLARIKMTPRITAKVDEITKGATTEAEKIARLYYWVQKNTRYISIKGSLGAGFSGHTAEETFENRYGDCTDKSILFTTMLKTIGVKAYPVILTTNDVGTGIRKIPTLSGNHCITEVCPGKQDYYLDATAENFRYPYFRPDDHGAYAMNAIRGDIRKIPVPPPSANARTSHLEVTLSANGDATVKTRNSYTGSYEAAVRGFWKQTREDNRKPMMAEYVNSISPGAILDTFTLTNLNNLAIPLVMTIDYRLPGLAVRAKDLMYFHVPTLDHEFPEAALDTRQYPIQYMTTEGRKLDVDISIPSGFHVKWVPPPLNVKNPYVEYHAKYEEGAGVIHFHETLKRLQRIVPVADYPAVRDALRSIAAFSKKEVYLTRKGA